MLKEFILTYLPKDELIVLSNVCHLVWAKSLKKSNLHTSEATQKFDIPCIRLSKKTMTYSRNFYLKI